MANHYLDLLIACCNRGQTSDIHGTFQVFVAMASWQNVEACMLVPITMYRTITHSLGLSWSLSLDSLLVTHSWLHSEKSRIDWHFLPQVWVAINIQTRRRLVNLFIMYTSHPPTMIDFHRRKKKNIWKRFRYWNYWGFQLERYPISLYLNYEDLIINKGW